MVCRSRPLVTLRVGGREVMVRRVAVTVKDAGSILDEPRREVIARLRVHDLDRVLGSHQWEVRWS